MNFFGLFGVIDIILVLLFIIGIIVGVKKGFLESFIKLASGIVGLVVAILFCQKFANLLISHEVFYDGIYTNLLTKIETTGGSSATEILNNLGFPSVISEYIGSQIISDLNLAELLATKLYTFFMVIISFFILFIGCWILSKILKLIVKVLKSVIIIKIVDSVLGVVLYSFLTLCLVYVLFFVLSLVIQIPSLESLNTFVSTDLQLTTDSFRLSKYFYENNILINFFKLFF